LYAGLEHFTNDGGDGAQYDISGEMEDIFQVISQVNKIINQHYILLI